MKKIVLALLIGILVGFIVRAQSLTAPAQGVTSTQTVATCPAPVAGTTWYCNTFAGPYISLNGAVYVAIPLTPAVAGVTSWNGQTGVVTFTPPAPPVTSVNGKTGAVVIAATTTSTTTSSTTLQ